MNKLKATHVFATVWLAATLSACGAAKPKQAGEDDNFGSGSETSSDSGSSGTDGSSAGSGSSTVVPDEGASGLNDEQKDQMKVALRRGGSKAAQCAKSVPDVKTFGDGEVQVTFDGKIGRSTEATVSAPFAGSELESCIKRAFIGEIIVPFEGQPMTVPYAIKIEKPGATAPVPTTKPKSTK